MLTSHAQNDSAAAPVEVTVNDQRNNNTNDENDQDVDRPAFCNNNNHNDNPERRDHEDKLKESAQNQPISGASASDRGGGGLIGTNLDPLSNFPTNLDNTELLTNNNARYREGKIVIEVQDGESNRIVDQVTQDTSNLSSSSSSSSSSSINRLAEENSTCKQELDNDEDDDNDPFDDDPFFKTRNIFADGQILLNGVGERPPIGTYSDDPSLMPSTSRRADLFSNSINSINDTTSLPSSSNAAVASGTWQSTNFRDVNEQIVSDCLQFFFRERETGFSIVDGVYKSEMEI